MTYKLYEFNVLVSLFAFTSAMIVKPNVITTIAKHIMIKATFVLKIHKASSAVAANSVIKAVRKQ